MGIGMERHLAMGNQDPGGEGSSLGDGSGADDSWISEVQDALKSVWDFLEFIGTPASAIQLVLYGVAAVALLRGRWRKRSRSEGKGKRPVVRASRLRKWKKQPLTKPPASVNRAAGDLMAEAMEKGLGVPLVYSPKKKRKTGTRSNGDSDSSKIDPPVGRPIINAYRRLKLYWLTHHTSSKTEFEVSDWQFAPAAQFEDHEGYRFSEALTLSFGLAPGELAEHFKRSFVTADKYKEKTVVVATPHNVHNQRSWVRRIVVESGRVGIDDQCRERIVLYSSPKAVAAGSHVGRIKRRKVPDDAIWLVCNTRQAAPPGPSWWEDPDECRSKHPVATIENDEQREHVQTLIKDDQYMRAGLWVILGPVLSGLLFASGYFDSDQDNKVFFITASVGWLILFMLASFGLLCHRLWGANRARRWLKKEGMTKDQWSGSTVRGLAVGKLANMVSVAKDNKRTFLRSLIANLKPAATLASARHRVAATIHETLGRYRRMWEKVKDWARLKRRRRPVKLD